MLQEGEAESLKAEKPSDELDVRAMTIVANVIMNLDEYLVIE